MEFQQCHTVSFKHRVDMYTYFKHVGEANT